MFLSKGKHLLIFNVQLCLTFESFYYVELEVLIVTTVQKSMAYSKVLNNCQH